MTLVQLAALSWITVANLSVLKNGRARAIRFSTLTAVCDVRARQPGGVASRRVVCDQPSSVRAS